MVGGAFITGTDTGVGKTFIAVALARALGARGFAVATMKPVATGAVATSNGLRSDDAVALMRAASVASRYEDVNPFVFAPATAPHIAAARVATVIDFTAIASAYARLSAGADIMVVEGVGGWRVPLNGAHTVADLARLLGLPVLLVAGIRLGCISHALLTAEAVRRDGCLLAGWIANLAEPGFADANEVADAIAMQLRQPPLCVMPWSASEPSRYLDKTADVLVETARGLS